MNNMTTDETIMTCATTTASKTFMMTTHEMLTTVSKARMVSALIWTNYTITTLHTVELI